MSPSITWGKFVASNIYIKGADAAISAKLYDNRSTISSTFAARFSGVFADVETPLDESGKH